MKTLVTGGAGFIGSKVAEILLDLGHDVIIVDSMNEDLYPAEEKVKRLARLREKFASLELIIGDLRSELCFESLRPFKGEVSNIIHLAALPGQRLSWKMPQEYLESNARASLNLAAWSTTNGVQHFTNVSTSSVYGSEAIGSESSPLRPTSPYGASKVAAEHMTSLRLSQSDVRLATIRLFSVYGPEQRPDMAYRRIIHSILTNSIFRMYGDGNQSRTNTYVSDAARGIVEASLGLKVATYNIGGSQSVTLNQAIDLIEDMMERKLEIQRLPTAAGDQLETRADTTRARAELGFENSVLLADGIEKQIDWQKSLIGEKRGS